MKIHGNSYKKTIQWQCASMGIFWYLWLECNTRIFPGVSSTGSSLCWGTYIASLWAKAACLSQDIPIAVLNNMYIVFYEKFLSSIAVHTLHYRLFIQLFYQNKKRRKLGKGNWR